MDIYHLSGGLLFVHRISHGVLKMLSRTFSLNPATAITKHKHQLVNPVIYLPVVEGRINSGSLVKIEIEIPEGYGFLDNVPTIGDFKNLVAAARKRFHIYEEIFEVSQLPTDKVKMKGGKGGVNTGNSNGQVVTASFLNKGDIKRISEMENLIPSSMDLPTARTLSRLASTIKRCGFLSDDDETVDTMQNYYRDSIPMFKIKNIEGCGTFHFTHLKHISAINL